MSINYAILGLLSYKPMTGYDLKKIIQDSPFMYWSGNNNQIYKALSELRDKGFVTNEIKHQEGGPTKKIYKITGEGLAALKEWVLSPIEPTEIKKPFLIHLAWSHQLNTEELNTLIDEYYHQVKMQLLMEQKNKDTNLSPNKTPLETTIWDFIQDNIIRTYKNELAWIEDLQDAISKIPNENDAAEKGNATVNLGEEKNDGPIKYTVSSSSEITYVHFNDTKNKIETERNIYDIITALVENDTHFVLLDSETLSKDFYESKKGLLAFLLQKFTMYNLKAAIVVKDHHSLKSEFREAIAENEKQNIIRLFTDIGDAEKWFLSQK